MMMDGYEDCEDCVRVLVHQLRVCAYYINSRLCVFILRCVYAKTCLDVVDVPRCSSAVQNLSLTSVPTGQHRRAFLLHLSLV